MVEPRPYGTARWCAAVWLTVLAAGCAGEPPRGTAETQSQNLVACTEPRPQMCTMASNPVCARLAVGDGVSWRTYPNACSACGEPRVTVYRPGGACR